MYKSIFCKTVMSPNNDKDHTGRFYETSTTLWTSNSTRRVTTGCDTTDSTVKFILFFNILQRNLKYFLNSYFHIAKVKLNDKNFTASVHEFFYYPSYKT